MIKGVNRRVVEVNEPDSAYFERILFFVKPDCCTESEAKLDKKARDIIKQTAGVPKNLYPAGRLKVANFLRMIISAGAGAAVTAIITALINN